MSLLSPVNYFVSMYSSISLYVAVSVRAVGSNHYHLVIELRRWGVQAGLDVSYPARQLIFMLLHSIGVVMTNLRLSVCSFIGFWAKQKGLRVFNVWTLTLTPKGGHSIQYAPCLEAGTTIALFPGHSRLQSLITCSMQIWRSPGRSGHVWWHQVDRW